MKTIEYQKMEKLHDFLLSRFDEVGEEIKEVLSEIYNLDMFNDYESNKIIQDQKYRHLERLNGAKEAYGNLIIEWTRHIK